MGFRDMGAIEKDGTGCDMGAIEKEAAAPSGTNTQINIGDAWKEIAAAQINIGDAWKAVAGMQVNIGDDWKSIF